MKTIIALGIGFFVGQQVTKSYQKRKAEQKKAERNGKLLEILKDLGVSSKEIRDAIHPLISG